MSEPLNTGAKHMTEYAAADVGRRGVAINRWLQPVLEYCPCQKTEAVRKQEQYIMQEKVHRELYEEIERLLPSLQYCLARRRLWRRRGPECCGRLQKQLA